MVAGGGGIAGTPARRQEDEQKERTGHARLDGFLHPALSSSTVPLLMPQLRTTIPPTANLSSSAKDEMRSSSSGTQISTCSAACGTSDRLCTRRANCSGAELLGVRWRTSGEDFPPEGRSKRKRLLRRGLKKGVGHPAAIEAAGRPGCSAPATLAPAAGRFPRTIAAQACRQVGYQVDGLTGGEGGTRAAPGTRTEPRLTRASTSQAPGCAQDTFHK